MIAGIRGKLVETGPLTAVVEAGGLLYEVNVPLTTSERLPHIGSEVMLYTLDVYREDSQSLYGFAGRRDRDFFKILVEKVSGIGPKTALNMLSRMSVEILEGAIASGDVGMLSKCPGIGNKTAQRLVVELKDYLYGGAIADKSSAVPLQVSGNSSETTSATADAVSALVALGFKIADADKAVRKASLKIDSPTAEQLIKFALTQ